MLIVFGYGLWRFGLLFAPKTENPPSVQSFAVHAYDKPEISLEKIKVKVFYFVPQDKVRGSRIVQNFPAEVAFFSETLRPQLEQFHGREWSNRSELQFAVYPNPIIGKQNADYYSKDFLSFQEEHPLGRLHDEISERLLHPGGDLYDAAFNQSDKNIYTIHLFIFDMPTPSKHIAGRSALVPGLTDDTEAASLVFSDIVDPGRGRVDYPNGTSIIYHELLHAMDVPEFYDADTENTFEKRTLRSDIMGSGADLPLSATYIGADIKEHMGFIAQ